MQVERNFESEIINSTLKQMKEDKKEIIKEETYEKDEVKKQVIPEVVGVKTHTTDFKKTQEPLACGEFIAPSNENLLRDRAKKLLQMLYQLKKKNLLKIGKVLQAV